MRALIAALLALASLHSPAARAAPDTLSPYSWPIASAWLETVSVEEQTIALAAIKSAFNDHIRYKLETAPAAKTVKGARWIGYIQIFGNLMLAKAATRQPEVADAFGESAENATLVLSGTIDKDTYIKRSTATANKLRQTFFIIGEAKIEQFYKLYKVRIDDATSALIVASKLLASGKLDSER